MRQKVTFRPLAEEDLTELYLYIAEQSGYPDRAMGYVRRLRDFCESLAAFPKRGQKRNDLRRGLWVGSRNAWRSHISSEPMAMSRSDGSSHMHYE